MGSGNRPVLPPTARLARNRLTDNGLRVCAVSHCETVRSGLQDGLFQPPERPVLRRVSARRPCRMLFQEAAAGVTGAPPPLPAAMAGADVC